VRGKKSLARGKKNFGRVVEGKWMLIRCYCDAKGEEQALAIAAAKDFGFY
jgi:hypothetical protein